MGQEKPRRPILVLALPPRCEDKGAKTISHPHFLMTQTVLLDVTVLLPACGWLKSAHLGFSIGEHNYKYGILFTI